MTIEAVTCPYCGKEWFNLFDDNPVCTRCINPAKRPKEVAR